MSKTRISLHEKLVEILGSRNVYFQPPESIKMAYPCFVYYLNPIGVECADNIAYMKRRKYTITYMDKNPDSDISDRMLEAFGAVCYPDTTYSAKGLHHFVFDVTY